MSQEEITQKTIEFSVQTAKFTTKTLHSILKFFMDKKNKPVMTGKQSLKNILRHGTGVSNMEIGQDIKPFERVMKKYGVDFAIKKDSATQPPTYQVFFKGRDMDVLNQAFKEYSHNKLIKKPSVLEKLKKMAEKTKEIPVLDKIKDIEKGIER